MVAPVWRIGGRLFSAASKKSRRSQNTVIVPNLVVTEEK